MNNHLVNWTPVKSGLPDSDLTVLVYCEKASEPVWLGFHDGEFWNSIDGSYLLGKHTPTHWALMPDGPVGGAQ